MPIPDYDINTYPDEHEEWMERLARNDGIIRCDPFETLPQDEPIHPDKVRFVCISDTHEKLEELLLRIPNGDVLLHAGDFTNFGERDALEKFNDQIGSLPHSIKIVIAGNHEIGFEDDDIGNNWLSMFTGKGTPKGYELLTNCVYLHDRAVKVFGLTIYGSSWHPLPGYPFYRERGTALAEKWQNIPEGLDVLITHTPPLGYLDDWSNGRHWGCGELLKAVQNRSSPPKFHVFGHVHERTGALTDGRTVFVNATICGHKLHVRGRPVLFDLPLPENYNKKEGAKCEFVK